MSWSWWVQALRFGLEGRVDENVLEQEGTCPLQPLLSLDFSSLCLEPWKGICPLAPHLLSGPDQSLKPCSTPSPVHAVLALPSRATLGIPWAVKRLFPLEQELGIMLHWESTGLALGGLQFIKAGEKRQFGGWRDWLLAPE